MIIEKQSGCFGEDITIDDKLIEDLPKEKVLKTIHKVLESFDLDNLIEVMKVAIEVSPNRKWEDLGQCEQCGSYSDKTTIKI